MSLFRKCFQGIHAGQSSAHRGSFGIKGTQQLLNDVSCGEKLSIEKWKHHKKVKPKPAVSIYALLSKLRPSCKDATVFIPGKNQPVRRLGKTISIGHTGRTFLYFLCFGYAWVSGDWLMEDGLFRDYSRCDRTSGDWVGQISLGVHINVAFSPASCCSRSSLTKNMQENGLLTIILKGLIVLYGTSGDYRTISIELSAIRIHGMG